MKKIRCNNLFARALAMALAASLAFPGTAFAAAAGTGMQDDGESILLEQDNSLVSEEAEDSLFSKEDAGDDILETAAQDEEMSEDVQELERLPDNGQEIDGTEEDTQVGPDEEDSITDVAYEQEESQKEAVSDEDTNSDAFTDEGVADDFEEPPVDEAGMDPTSSPENEAIDVEEPSEDEAGIDPASNPEDETMGAEESSEDTTGTDSPETSEDISNDVQEDAVEAGTKEASTGSTAAEEEAHEGDDRETSSQTAAGTLNPVYSLYFYNSNIEMSMDDLPKVQLDVQVSYEDDYDTVYDGEQPYFFRSGDENIVTVDEKGLLTAVGAGETQVYVYTGTYGSDDYYEWDNATVTVLGAMRTILFDLDGGAWEDSNYEEEYSNGHKGRDGDEFYLPGSYYVKKDGSKFLGWTTTKNGTVLDSSYYTINGDATIYAKWEKFPTLKLDLNGGKWEDSSSYYATQYKNGYTGEKGGTVYLPSSYEIVRTGYIFLGWTTTKNGTVLDSSYYTLNSDATIYAKWEKLPTLKLDLNGGKWEDSSSYYATQFKNGYTGEKGQSVYLPYSYYVVRTGYKFLGWTTTKNGTKYAVDSNGGNYTLSADTTLYAKWQKLICLKLNLNGGKWKDSSSYTAKEFKNGYYDEKGKTAYLPGDYDVVRSGYIFKGWTTTKNGTTFVSSSWGDSYKITKDVTLYAKWAPAVNVTLNAGKGYFGSNKNTKKVVLKVEKGLTVGDEIYYDIYDDNVPQNGSSAFEGWYKDAKLTKPVKRSDVLSKNITYYAKWQAKTYKITVTNLKGASYTNRASGEYVSSSNSKAASYSFYISRGDSIGYLSASKNGQECMFYFDKACKQKPFYSSFIPTANTIVYAKFLNEVTITWNGNGGATSYGSKTGKDTCTKNLMWEYRPTVVRAGYYFVGWVDTAKPSVVLPASHVFAKDTTVKAKWAKAIKVTFNPNGGKWSTSDKKSTNKVYYTRAKAKLGKYIDYVDRPLKSGYTFMGWKSSLTKKKVADIFNEKPAKAVTYTAIWSKSSVKVTLMASEGSIYDSTSGKYVTKSVVSVPKNAKLKDVSLRYDNHDEPSKRLGFAGWSLKKNGKVLADTYKFTKAVKLYPVWNKSASLRVALVTNGGAIDGYPNNDPDVQYAKKGDILKLPTGSRIEREGYKFVGWYTDFKCTKKVSNPNKYKVTKSCYLYAKWKKK